MERLWLIGLSGSGKSTLGALAADALGWTFFDTDQVVEERENRSVASIFREEGEGAFRRMETGALQAAAAQTGAVIATGGGAVLDAANRKLMRDSGFVILLNRPVERILTTAVLDDRPLLSGHGERLHDLWRQRESLYRETAHVTLTLHGGREESLTALLAAVRAETITEGYALIGDPVAHTLSPLIHETVFRALGRTESYTALHVPGGGLPRFMRRAREHSLPGFNVTIPHKRDIIPLLDETDEAARRCGSVNTVVNRGGQWIGYNTDMEGLFLSLQDAGRGFSGEHITLLGTGGAAEPIAHNAVSKGAASLTLYGRSKEAADRIAQRVGENFPAAVLQTGVFRHRHPRLDLGHTTMLINATPLGMQGFGEDFGDFTFLKSLPSNALVCDLITNPPMTSLRRAAQNQGLPTINGMGMLIYQALLADEHFLGAALDKNMLYHNVLQSRKEDKPCFSF